MRSFFFKYLFLCNALFWWTRVLVGLSALIIIVIIFTRFILIFRPVFKRKKQKLSLDRVKRCDPVAYVCVEIKMIQSPWHFNFGMSQGKDRSLTVTLNAMGRYCLREVRCLLALIYIVKWICTCIWLIKINTCFDLKTLNYQMSLFVIYSLLFLFSCWKMIKNEKLYFKSLFSGENFLLFYKWFFFVWNSV